MPVTVSVPVLTGGQTFTDAATPSTGVLRDSQGGVTHASVTTAKVIITGNVFINETVITSNYAVIATDNVILANATGGAIAVTLPAPAANTGRVLRFKKTDSSGNAVTITQNAAEKIDGANTLALASQYNHAMLICDGTNWQVF